MAKTKVYAPNGAYTGISAGVPFTNGVGETDNPAALAFFRRSGYGIGARADEQASPEPAPYEPTPSEVKVGRPLRDAAVDPRARDFLPPTNAGEADPHGPLVVSPGIHGVGPKPIRPGEVFVANPNRQEAEETELAERTLVEPVEPATIASGIGRDGDVSEAQDRPAKAATKAAWVDYAVSRGIAREEAEDLTKADIQERLETA